MQDKQTRRSMSELGPQVQQAGEASANPATAPVTCCSGWSGAETLC